MLSIQKDLSSYPEEWLNDSRKYKHPDSCWIKRQKCLGYLVRSLTVLFTVYNLCFGGKLHVGKFKDPSK